MKILINTSNLYVGGGVQVAISFLNELNNLQYNYKYYIFLSRAIKERINQNIFSNNFIFYTIDITPAKIKTRYKINKIMSNLENQINPDIVFTIFGPSYWRPKTKHIMGFADPWVLNPNSIAFKRLNFFKRLKVKMLCKYKKYHLKREANYYIVETNDAKDKLYDIVKKDIFVVGNCYNSFFDDELLLSENSKYYIKLPIKQDKEFRFVLISYNYPHKNILVIKDIIKRLNSKNIKFVLTIDEDSFGKYFYDVKEYIINLGSIHPKSCPSVYDQCDALFLPSLLEVFSASYPEAMKMKKPILTSNYSFAKDICGHAALYFDPLNPYDIVKKIKMIYSNKDLYQKLVKKGVERLKSFETARSRAEKYIKIMESICAE